MVRGLRSNLRVNVGQGDQKRVSDTVPSDYRDRCLVRGQYCSNEGGTSRYLSLFRFKSITVEKKNIGTYLHSPRPVPRKPRLIDSRCFGRGIKYLQWGEIQGILNQRVSHNVLKTFDRIAVVEKQRVF